MKRKQERFGMMKIKTLQWFGMVRHERNPHTQGKAKGLDFGLSPDVVIETTGRAPSYADLAVYVALLGYRNKNGLCWMSQSSISKDTNLSRNTVQKSWRWLQSVGLIEPNEDIHVARRPGRQMSATVWTVYQYPNQSIEVGDRVPGIESMNPKFYKHRVVCDECGAYHHRANDGWDQMNCPAVLDDGETECNAVITNPDLGISGEYVESWQRSKTKAKLDAQGIETGDYWGGDMPLLEGEK